MESWLKRTVWGSGRIGLTDMNGTEIKGTLKMRPGREKVNPTTRLIMVPMIYNDINVWVVGSHIGGITDPAVIYKA